jgi:hypothetical protein
MLAQHRMLELVHAYSSGSCSPTTISRQSIASVSREYGLRHLFQEWPMQQKQHNVFCQRKWWLV